MAQITIRTNNHFRHLINFHELSTKEQNEIKDDYEAIQEATFFRYKGLIYNLDSFMHIDKNAPFKGKWHGYESDSFFSGTLIELSEDGDSVKVGNYIS